MDIFNELCCTSELTYYLLFTGFVHELLEYHC